MDLKFKNGHLYNNEKTQLILCPSNSFICLLNEIITHENSENIQEIFIQSSHIDSYLLYKKIREKYKSKIEILKKTLDEINSLGMGKIELKFINQDKAIFNFKSVVLDKLYENLYCKKPKHFLGEILIGFLIHSLEYIYEKEINYEYKRFNSEIILTCNFINEKKDFENLKKIAYNNEKEVEISSILKKIIVNKHIVISEGTFNIWNTYGVLIPYFFLIEITRKLSFEKYKEFFEKLGLMQGKAAVGLQKDLFGIKKNELFHQILEQSELIGMGKCHDIVINENCVNYLLINNLPSHFQKYYKKEDYNLIKIYFSNIIRGVFEYIFEKKTIYEINENNNTLIIEKGCDYFLDEKETQIDKIISVKALIYRKNKKE